MLGEPAVETRALVGREVVAVDAVAVGGDHDVAHRDPVPFLDAPLRRGFGTDPRDAPDDLVAGDRRELAAPSGVDMAAEVVDVAVTQTGRLDPHHRAARLRVGHDELTQLPRLVAVEDD